MEEAEPVSTIPKLLAKNVATRGKHEAIIKGSETLTYEELDRRTAKMARALLAVGAGKGTKIALLSPDGIYFLTIYLACLRIGAHLTTVSTLGTPPELAHILRNSDAQFIIGARRFLRHDYAKKLTDALPGLADGKAGSLRILTAPYLRAIWLDDAEGLGWARPTAELIARADAPDAPDAALLAAVESQVVPSDDAVVIYTSGSTSTPKAVMHTHWNIVRHPLELTKYFRVTENDRAMPLLPAFWLGGQMMMMEVLNMGGTLVYPETPDQEVVLDAIQRHKVNRVNSWGDMLTKLREAAVARGIDVAKIVGLGEFRDESGEIIPPQLQTSLLGMSETFAVHSGERVDQRLPDEKAGAAGRAVNGYERRIVNPETGEEVAPGEIGELQVRGGALMSGFYKIDRRKVFTPDGYYPTNDLVRIDADGYLFFIARRGDMLKTRAANVSRLEVEAALRALPGVDLPIVVGLPDPELGQRIVAAVVPKEGATLTEDGLKTALRDTLSNFEISRNIIFITEADVPRTSTGKMKLFELADFIKARLGDAGPAADVRQKSAAVG